MTAPHKPKIVTEVIVHKPLVVPIPPDDPRYSAENPAFPWEPCVWRTFDCDDLPGGRNAKS